MEENYIPTELNSVSKVRTAGLEANYLTSENIDTIYLTTDTGKIIYNGTVYSDSKKLAGIAEGANKYVLPAATSSTLGGVKVGTNLTINNGVLSATNLVTWKTIE